MWTVAIDDGEDQCTAEISSAPFDRDVELGHGFERGEGVGMRERLGGSHGRPIEFGPVYQ